MPLFLGPVFVHGHSDSAIGLLIANLVVRKFNADRF